MRRAVDIARKLELTALALGCLTRKELCAAFVRVNPNTIMTLQNCYNWQSGRSVPRSFGVFEDWAAVIGIAEGPLFVMSSGLSEFARVLADRFPLPDDLVEAFAGPPPRPAATPAPDGEMAAWDSTALLHGSFLALSFSWSPRQRGRLLSGVLTLDADGGGLTARYRENILGRTVLFTGDARTDGRTCQVTLRCMANGGTFLMALHLPVLPGNLAGGIFAGSTIYDPDSDPTASVILLLRIHARPVAEIEEASGYLDFDAAAIAPCLDRLGYGRDPALAAEREILRLLSAGEDTRSVSLRRHLLGRAAALLDRRHLDAVRGRIPA